MRKYAKEEQRKNGMVTIPSSQMSWEAMYKTKREVAKGKKACWTFYMSMDTEKGENNLY